MIDTTERDEMINRIAELLEVAHSRDQEHFSYLCDRIEESL